MFCTNCGNNLEIGIKFCTSCGQEAPIQENGFVYWLKIHKKTLILMPLGLVVLLIVIGVYRDDSSSVNSYTSTPQKTETSFKQTEVASPVVNILCPSTVSDNESSGGSGTIISDDGIILTNSHIIPQDDKELHVDEDGCLVVLSDSSTGQASGYYVAHPVVLPGLSDDYDLAFMKIYSAYYDTKEQKYIGTYPRKFPTYKCENDNVKLGDSVRVFGYPAISGGYSLTVTDGVVSSLSGNGLIYTSAKISHGNSGGLAVDENDCMIGVPSMVSTDENESLGIIYSMDLVNEFVTKFAEQYGSI